jgi:hypothetical protein
MRSTRVGGFRPFARAGVVASAIALIAMALSASSVFAATVIGSATSGSFTCPAGYDTVQISSNTGTYAVPAGGGSISSWTTQSGSFIGRVGLQVWRPTATAQTYQLVGASPLVTGQASTLNTFTLANPIPVQAGDLLGLRVDGRAYCEVSTSSPADVYGSVLGANPAVGAIDTFTPTNTSLQLDVAATVDAIVTPPPPPGCDSTGNSGDSTTTPADSSGGSTDASAPVSPDVSAAASTDTATVDSTDQAKSDAVDKADKEKDKSGGNDNCQQ